MSQPMPKCQSPDNEKIMVDFSNGLQIHLPTYNVFRSDYPTYSQNANIINAAHNNPSLVNCQEGWKWMVENSGICKNADLPDYLNQRYQSEMAKKDSADKYVLKAIHLTANQCNIKINPQS